MPLRRADREHAHLAGNGRRAGCVDAGRHARLGPPVRGLGPLEVVKPDEAPMMNAAVIKMLTELGVERDNILLDDFGG